MAGPRSAVRPPRPSTAEAGPRAGLPGGRLPAWLEAPFEALAPESPPALLLHGPAGVGGWELAVALAAAALCEAPAGPARPGGRACGACPGCALSRAGTHPDLLLVLPEALRPAWAWGAAEDEAPPEAEPGPARKPSAEIKVEALRATLAFAQQTSARGGAKLVLLAPAERLNAVAANALLKTLEEPPPGLRFILWSAAPQRLLPTVRSRCRAWRLALPERGAARAWLEAQGLDQAEARLAAAGGAPLEALARAEAGEDPAAWQGWPEALAAGEAGWAAELPRPRLLEALARLATDLARVAAGAAPASCAPAVLAGFQPGPADLPALAQWAAALRHHARRAEHPLHAALAQEAILAEAQACLGRLPRAGAAARRVRAP